MREARPGIVDGNAHVIGGLTNRERVALATAAVTVRHSRK